MAFSNPIVGANDTLVRNAIQSDNYVPGISGWRIERNGDAEFNDVDIRGDVEIGPAGGPQVLINANPGYGAIQFPTHHPSETDPASIFSYDTTPPSRRVLTIQSATTSPVPGPVAQIRLSSESDTFLTPPGIALVDITGGTPITLASFNRNEIYLPSYLIGGKGSVYKANDFSTLPNSTAMFQAGITAISLAPNAVYRIKYVLHFESNNAANLFIKTQWLFGGTSTYVGGLVKIASPTNTTAEYTSPTNARSRFASADPQTVRTHLLSPGGTIQGIVEEGIVETGPLIGGSIHTVDAMFGQNASAVGQTLTLKKYSYVEWERIT